MRSNPYEYLIWYRTCLKGTEGGGAGLKGNLFDNDLTAISLKFTLKRIFLSQ